MFEFASGIAPAFVFLLIRLALAGPTGPARRERRTKIDQAEYPAATSERPVSVECSVTDDRAARAAQKSLHGVRLRARGAGLRTVRSSDRLRLRISAARGPLPGSRMH